MRKNSKPLVILFKHEQMSKRLRSFPAIENTNQIYVLSGMLRYCDAVQTQGILRLLEEREDHYDISVYFKTTEILPRSHVQLGSASEVQAATSGETEVLTSSGLP